MASTLANGGYGTVTVNGIKSEKKLKREKSEKSKKRARPADQDSQLEEEPRRHKKSKKHTSSDQPNGDEIIPKADLAYEEGSKESYKKYNKSNGLTNGNIHPATTELVQDVPAEDGETATKSTKKHRKREKLEQSLDTQSQPSPEPAAEPKKRRSKDKHKGAAEEAIATTAEAGLEVQRRDKKAKKSKKHLKEEGEEASSNSIEADGAMGVDKGKDEKRKRKHLKTIESTDRVDAAVELEPHETKRASKKNRKEGKRKHSPDRLSQPNDAAVDCMDIDVPDAASPVVASAVSEDPIFPFFTQTASFYVPFFPVGFDKPVTNITSQHLDPLLNHYSPLFRGVLLGYHNVNLSERPARADPKNPPTDETGAVLTSVDEYAVGFGWLTADLDLFMPRRGAWMEGTVNLQSEGHIGVVCWDKFNASIEAKRLPSGWRWVDLTAKGRANGKANGKANDALESPKSDDDEEEEGDALDDTELEVAQMHTTGYWVDDTNGQKRISGKLRFRVKNFDVGLAGDYGYLSIEGTMLGKDDEKALAALEREAERKRRRKQSYGGLLRPMSRRVPEFSMTKFGREDEEEDSGQRTELYKGSRPGTPDD